MHYQRKLQGMTPQEAYDLACKKWGDGVALNLGGRYIVGRWLATAEVQGPEILILASKTKAVEVMGESLSSWEEAFSDVR